MRKSWGSLCDATARSNCFPSRIPLSAAQYTSLPEPEDCGRGPCAAVSPAHKSAANEFDQEIDSNLDSMFRHGGQVLDLHSPHCRPVAQQQYVRRTAAPLNGRCCKGRHCEHCRRLSPLTVAGGPNQALTLVESPAPRPQYSGSQMSRRSAGTCSNSSCCARYPLASPARGTMEQMSVFVYVDKVCSCRPAVSLVVQGQPAGQEGLLGWLVLHLQTSRTACARPARHQTSVFQGR